MSAQMPVAFEPLVENRPHSQRIKIYAKAFLPICAMTLIGLVATCYGMASADSVYVGFGDSVTFGETNLKYVPSYGDRDMSQILPIR